MSGMTPEETALAEKITEALAGRVAFDKLVVLLASNNPDDPLGACSYVGFKWTTPRGVMGKMLSTKLIEHDDILAFVDDAAPALARMVEESVA